MTHWVKVVELPGMCNEPNVGPAERDGKDSSCFRLEPWTTDNLDKHYCEFCNHWKSKEKKSTEEVDNG